LELDFRKLWKQQGKLGFLKSRIIIIFTYNSKTREMTRKTTETEKKVFQFLNDLRLSGITNMFEARPYIVETFGLPTKKAGDLLLSWMKNFNDEANYETIKTDD